MKALEAHYAVATGFACVSAVRPKIGVVKMAQTGEVVLALKSKVSGVGTSELRV